MNKRYGIAAIGYNRPDSMKRLLDALDKVEFGGRQVLLIISLDYAGMPEMSDLAEDYKWKHGEKVVIAYPERQGLRGHVLQCGDYLEKYDLDAMAVFEDDVFPSPAFFNYMVQAVDFYGDCEEIAGISLYTHLWNEVYSMPFQPLYCGSDVYFMQYAQSWGQIWLPAQWKEFKKWYQEHSENFSEAEGVPSAVSRWKDSSWLKYHIRYCVEKNKYFVYPYESLTTNFTEIGTHNQYRTALYQVPLQVDAQKRYRFGLLDDKQSVVYDAFFENTRIAEVLGIPSEELCVDLYGSKPDTKKEKYWLTTICADYRLEKSFGLSLRPQELNVMLNIPGTEIKLYNLSCHKDEKQGDSLTDYQFFDYYYRLTHARWKGLARFLLEKIKMRIKK